MLEGRGDVEVQQEESLVSQFLPLSMVQKIQKTGLHRESGKKSSTSGNIQIGVRKGDKTVQQDQRDETIGLEGDDDGIRADEITGQRSLTVTLPPMEQINSKLVNYSRVIKESWMGRASDVIAPSAPVHMQRGPSSISQGLKGNVAPGSETRDVPADTFPEMAKSPMKSAPRVKKPWEVELLARRGPSMADLDTGTASAIVAVSSGRPEISWVREKSGGPTNALPNVVGSIPPRRQGSALPVAVTLDEQKSRILASTSRPPRRHGSALPVLVTLDEQKSRIVASTSRLPRRQDSALPVPLTLDEQQSRVGASTSRPLRRHGRALPISLEPDEQQSRTVASTSRLPGKQDSALSVAVKLDEQQFGIVASTSRPPRRQGKSLPVLVTLDELQSRDVASTSRPPRRQGSALPVSVILEEQRSRVVASIMKMRGYLLNRCSVSSHLSSQTQQRNIKLPPLLIAEGQHLSGKCGIPIGSSTVKRSQRIAFGDDRAFHSELVVTCDRARFLVDRDLIERASPVIRSYFEYKVVPKNERRFINFSGMYSVEIVETLLNYLNNFPFNELIMASPPMMKVVHELKICVKTSNFKSFPSKK